MTSDSRFVRGAALLVLFGGVGFGLFWLMRGNARDAEALPDEVRTESTGPVARIPFENTGDWLGKLRTKAEVSFVREAKDSAAPREEILKLTSLGRLEGQDLVFALEMAATLYQTRTSTLATFQQNMQRDSLRDAHREAVMLKEVEVALAVGQQLKSGDYFVLPLGQTLPEVSGERLSFGIMHGGKQATAFFIFDGKAYPQIGEMRKYERGVRSAWIDDLVTKFNTRPFAERQELLSKHDRLLELPANARASEDQNFLLEMFPIGVGIDVTTSTLFAVPVD